MDKETHRLLYEVLKPEDNPYGHDLKARWMGDPPSKGQIYDCSKCLKMFDSNDEAFDCPIPDDYPGSLPEIAEEIRVWMKTNDDDPKQYEGKYQYEAELRRICAGTEYNCHFACWMTYACTPLDKINAFVEVMKGANE